MGGVRSERAAERREGRCGRAGGSAPVSTVAAHPWRVGPPSETEMLLSWKPGLPLRLLLLLGPLCPCSPGALAELAPAEDVVVLVFSTERPVHLVSPAFLSFTIDANLATDPRFLTFLG